MTTFKATTEGTDKLGLRAVLEGYANDRLATGLLRCGFSELGVNSERRATRKTTVFSE